MPAPPLGITARAEVERVVDGDTVDVVLRIPVRVRLLNCWAPETRGFDAVEGAKAKSQLEKMLPMGCRVVVHVPTAQVDAMSGVFTFGRVLAEIYHPMDDESISQQMVRTGLATEAKP